MALVWIVHSVTQTNRLELKAFYNQCLHLFCQFCSMLFFFIFFLQSKSLCIFHLFCWFCVDYCLEFLIQRCCSMITPWKRCHQTFRKNFNHHSDCMVSMQTIDHQRCSRHLMQWHRHRFMMIHGNSNNSKRAILPFSKIYWMIWCGDFLCVAFKNILPLFKLMAAIPFDNGF